MPLRRRRSYRFRVPRRVYRSTYRRAARSSQRQFAAAYAQRDVARFTLKYTLAAPLQFSVTAGLTAAGKRLDVAQLLLQNPQYTAFTSLFDEAKINGIRLKFTPMFQVGTPAEFTAAMRPVLAWAWDRNGVTRQSNIEGSDAFTVVSSYGSARTMSLAPGTSGAFVSSIYATDLIERSSYWGTRQIAANSSEQGLLQSAFMPDFMLAIQLPGEAVATTTFFWQVEAAFDMTFRGVRYSGASV